MISVQEAEEQVLSHCTPLPETTVPLDQARGLSLSRAITASHDVPPFHRAMMDGFALRAADTEGAPVRLQVNDFVPAGSLSSARVLPGTATRIATGAPLPEGADAVQMREVCLELEGGLVEIQESLPPGRHVATRGSEFPAGETVLHPGHPLKPTDLAILATFGQVEVPVHPHPRVCLINTGSELVKASESISGGKIRNSNEYSVAAFLEGSGFPVSRLGIVEDRDEAIRASVRQAAADFDVVLLTGGVSEGDLDLVGGAVAAEGFQTHFHRVAIKPGKPSYFATRGPILLFGLSGNPVSSLVQTVRFVLPALRRMAGWADVAPRALKVPLLESVMQKPGRLGQRPCRLEIREGRLGCLPLRDKGSADLFAWREADGLYLLPPDTTALSEGAEVEVLLLEGIFPIH